MNCSIVSPGQNLQSWQKTGLELVANIYGGRDVVLAIDLTESVGLNDEGRIRLRQIVEDSLRPGDKVYVVPFATIVNPLTPKINPLTVEGGVKFNGKQDISKILELIPFKPNLTLQNTDVQRAELFIYQNLAQINQCRLGKSQPIKPQSVIWITDAPLLTAAGIDSNVWIETPRDSPFRVENSEESERRISWINALPLNNRKLLIRTENGEEYQLAVVDIAPTVQEFCTPAPGGRETCLVNSYLGKLLWLPGLIFLLVFIGFIVGVKKWMSLQKKWVLVVDFTATKIEEDQICRLPNNKRIAIGEYDDFCVDSIDTPGPEIRGFLIRKGNRLYLEPTGDAEIYLNGKKVSNSTPISSSQVRLNCPYGRNRDYEIIIKIKK
ncbi:MAG: VWA domain-containing protein [Okeania sp. SIO3B3]|nr:VWA domain-containing protein [Okeania sp. SIO3B3]